MALQVVDRGQRQPPRGRQALGRGHADQQRAHQPRPLRHRDQLDLVQARALQRLVDDGVDQLEVVPRRPLGHDAAEAVVHALGGHDVRADLTGARDDGGARVVAGGLDGEDHVPGTSSRVPRKRRRGAPHHDRVLTVVLVVAPAHARRAEAEALVERDRARVGAPHLERQLRVALDALEHARDQRGGDPAARGAADRRRRSSRARPCRSASRSGSRPARCRPRRRGRSPTAWRARARTSRATTGS